MNAHTTAFLEALRTLATISLDEVEAPNEDAAKRVVTTFEAALSELGLSFGASPSATIANAADVLCLYAQELYPELAGRLSVGTNGHEARAAETIPGCGPSARTDDRGGNAHSGEGEGTGEEAGDTPSSEGRKTASSGGRNTSTSNLGSSEEAVLEVPRQSPDAENGRAASSGEPRVDAPSKSTITSPPALVAKVRSWK